MLCMWTDPEAQLQLFLCFCCSQRGRQGAAVLARAQGQGQGAAVLAQGHLSYLPLPLMHTGITQTCPIMYAWYQG